MLILKPLFRCATTVVFASFLVVSFNSISHSANVANNGDGLATLSTWIALDAPPGWEHLATDVIQKAMPGWKKDSLGNLILRKGSGSPRRVVACGLDRPGFAVTEITETGYLRFREAGSLRVHPLWIQFHEGQRIKVLTRTGPIPGVVIVKSTHLQRGRPASAPVTTLDDLWIDIGANSRPDVARLGVQMLDPIVRDPATWSFGDFVAGPAASVRVGCAAVATAARGQVSTGETIFVLSTLRSFGDDGLEAALRSLGHVDEVTLIEQATDSSSAAAVTQRKVEKPAYLPESAGVAAVNVLVPRVRYAGTLVESLQLSDANALLASVSRAAAVDLPNVGWVTLPTQRDERPRREDFLSPIANLLKSLADLPGVSGHEGEVREAIIASLPAWAKAKATIDADGNLIVEAGPDKDPVMFIAHQDEVGFEVTNIADDGVVSLRTRGGLFQSLWEGQPALLHFDAPGKPSLRGVFVPRETATTKQPEAVTAWFGTDAAGLKRLGVTTGVSITADKHATRLGSTKFTARALDDRAGSTALILAIRRIDPNVLKHKVVFAWSVREETGLEGARVLAERYGNSVKRVFSIDTFVSSDSPAEITRFAYAPLGSGAVIRGLDNSAVAAPAELDRVLRIARIQRSPLQVGATNGGTDGSDFIRYGALHVSLSWPGRYSHSPVEVLDLRDLDALEKLIYGLSIAP